MYKDTAESLKELSDEEALLGQSENRAMIIEGFYHYHLKLLDIIESSSGNLSHRHIAKAKEFIEKNFSDSNVSLSTTAEFVGIHPAYLSKLFKENAHLSFVDYLNEYRISEAKLLLEDENLAVKDIAERVGFQSMATFFRVFKKICNASPGEFRKQNQLIKK